MAQSIDPVCGMTVDSETTKFKSEHGGQTYYFCAPGCKTAFDKDPAKYLKPAKEEHEHHRHH